MTKLQNDKNETLARIKKFLSKYATDLATIIEAAVEIATINNSTTIITNAAQLQADPVGDAADAAEVAKMAMGNLLHKFALRAAIKAKQLGNVELSGKLRQPISFYTLASKGLAVQRCSQIKQLMSDNAAILTNIVAANHTDMAAAITKYNDLKEVPIQEIQNKSANATDVLPDAFKAAFDAIDNLYDLVFSYFNDVAAKKAIVSELALAKQIIRTGVHYTGIAGDVTVNGQEVEGAIIEIVGTKKKAVADFHGHYSILKVKAGSYHVKATLPSGQTLTIDIDIEKGHTETLDFHF